MKEFNFDRMSNFDTPDEWADKVINTVSDIKPSYAHNHRIIASCLCLTFVCILSAVFFGYCKNTPTALPIATTNEIQKETNPINSNIDESMTFPTEKETVDKALVQTDGYDEEITNTNPPQTEPIETTVPTIAPTKQPSENPIEPTTPDNTLPTADTTEDTTSNPNGVGDCLVGISPSYLVGSAKVYCRIKNSNNESIGDSNLLSEQHLARFYSGFGSMYYYLYSPQSVGLILEPGVYKYFFYNEHGVPICETVIEIQ